MVPWVLCIYEPGFHVILLHSKKNGKLMEEKVNKIF